MPTRLGPTPVSGLQQSLPWPPTTAAAQVIINIHSSLVRFSRAGPGRVHNTLPPPARPSPAAASTGGPVTRRMAAALAAAAGPSPPQPSEQQQQQQQPEAEGGLTGLKFPPPIRSYDVHIYFFQTDPAHADAARQLRDDIQRQFPDLKVYKFWEQPIGPHPVGMFEVDLKSPAEFAAFVPWVHVNRRGLSVLVHPNTGRPLDDHTVNAMWVGDKVALNTAHLKLEDEQYGFWT